MNNRGFTLVELLATLILLALVIGLGSVAITSLINNAKNKNYALLITNIKDGAEVYYQECKYANNSRITCTGNANNGYTITLGELVTYGYVKGNSTDESKKYTIVNPLDDENIKNCQIKVTYTSGKTSVSAINPSGSCPTNDDYK